MVFVPSMDLDARSLGDGARLAQGFRANDWLLERIWKKVWTGDIPNEV